MACDDLGEVIDECQSILATEIAWKAKKEHYSCMHTRSVLSSKLTLGGFGYYYSEQAASGMLVYYLARKNIPRDNLGHENSFLFLALTPFNVVKAWILKATPNRHELADAMMKFRN